MKQYQFTIETQPKLSPLPCQSCKVTVKFEADQPTLADLAELLIPSLGFQCDHAFGFYSNLESAYGPCESKFTAFADFGQPEDNEPGVQETAMDDVFEEGKQMLLIFDYGDDWHFLVSCLSISKATGKKTKHPKMIETNIEGTPPEQYPQF